MENIVSKQKSEANFWRYEIMKYVEWYNGKVSSLYYTLPPRPEQRIVGMNAEDSAIRTWTELHQKPKYLNELQLHSKSFTGKKVLDVGAGPIPSATCFEDCQLYALDPLHSEYRRFGFPQYLYPEVTFITASAEEIPVEDDFFDSIISVNAIDHVDDLARTAKELQRVAKPDCSFDVHVHYHLPMQCEPIEINDSIFL